MILPEKKKVKKQSKKNKGVVKKKAGTPAKTTSPQLPRRKKKATRKAKKNRHDSEAGAAKRLVQDHPAVFVGLAPQAAEEFAEHLYSLGSAWTQRRRGNDDGPEPAPERAANGQARVRQTAGKTITPALQSLPPLDLLVRHALEKVDARDEIISRGQDEWRICCPQCPLDKERKKNACSVNIKTGLFMCHRCQLVGGVLQLYDALGIELPTAESDREIEFIYRDEEGGAGYLIKKTGGNPPYSAHHFVEGKLVPKMGEVRRIPYCLDRLVKTSQNQRVLVVEGEKDVDTCWLYGFPATTNPFGAGKWKDEYSEFLRDRDVIILPDNDDVGRDHAEKVRRSLEGVARSVRILELPGLDVGEDISDWFVKGHDPNELKRLLASRSSSAGEHSFITVYSVAELADPEPPKYAVDGLLFEETFMIMGGDPKVGKTTLCLHLALGFLAGHRVLGQFEVLKPGPVVFVQCDMGAKYFQGALRQVAAVCGVQVFHHPFHFRCTSGVDLSSPETRNGLATQIASYQPELVILVPMRDFFLGNENSSQELKPVLDFAIDLRNRNGGVVIFIDHLVKSRERSGSAGYLLRGGGSKFGRADSVFAIERLQDRSKVRAIHRYAADPEPFYYHFTGASELEICGPPENDTEENLKAKIEEFLGDNPDWQSTNKILKKVGGHRRKLKEVLEAMKKDGEVEWQKGTRNSDQWRLTSYRDEDG